MTDNPDLHRDDVQLLAGFFADSLFAAAAVTGQFVFRQFMHYLDTRQLRRQRFAFAAFFGRLGCHDFFIVCRRCFLSQAFCLVEHAQLRRVRIRTLLGCTPEQTLT